jgi:molybdenum cofactor biosynthesis enzyme
VADSGTQSPPEANDLPQSEKVLLKALWENGMTDSTTFPATLETIRQKYDMTTSEYDSYWRLAAGSLLNVAHVGAKARRKLRSIEAQLGQGPIVPKTPDHESSSHQSLINEVKRIAREPGMQWAGEESRAESEDARPPKKSHDAEDNSPVVKNISGGETQDTSPSIKKGHENLEATQGLEDSQDVEKKNQSSQEISRIVQDLLADMDRHVPRIAKDESFATYDQDRQVSNPFERESFGAYDMDRQGPRRSQGSSTGAYGAERRDPRASVGQGMGHLNLPVRGHKTLRFGKSNHEVEHKDKSKASVDALVRESAKKASGEQDEPGTGKGSKRVTSRVYQEAEQQDRSETSTGPKTLTRRAKWRENKKLLARQEERAAWEEIESEQRTVIKELTALQAVQREQKEADDAQKFERKKKLRQLSQLRSKLQEQKKELYERLRAEEEALVLEKKAREEAPHLEQLAMIAARKAKAASLELGDLLDVAVEKTTEKAIMIEDLMVEKNTGRPTTIEDLMNKVTLTRPMTTPTAARSLARERSQDASIKTVFEQPSRSRVIVDDLHLSVPASGEIPIDSSLTLTLNSDTPTLQSQVLGMQSRLSTSFPRIDTLPYNIAESKNNQTLRTWLKILAGRYQTRFNETEDATEMESQVKAVLDQMVRDHDLSNSAAQRMAEKWSKIFEKRAADAEELDEEELDAGGMSFLKADDVDVESMVGSSKHEHEATSAESEESIDQDESSKLDAFAAEASKHSKPSEPKTIPLISSTKNSANSTFTSLTRRLYSTSSRPPKSSQPKPSPSQTTTTTTTPSLPHLTPSGSAHMVSVSSKAHTTRTAIAVGTVYFSNPTPLSLITSNSLKKGDVLSVSRIAGIMAAKKCPDLIPLCHPIPLTHVGVELRVFGVSKPHSNDHAHDTSYDPPYDAKNDMGFGGVAIEAKVECTGPTGVEMEALTSVMGTALSVVDMCKAVDKFMRIQDVRVVLKEGGKSGVWKEEEWRSWQG